MQKQETKFVYVMSEKRAREKIKEWYADKKDLRISSCIPDQLGDKGYKVTFSYDEDNVTEGRDMSLREQIMSYNAILDQEKKDKEMFLEYMDTFFDVLTRKNKMAHFTSSAFIVNEERTKVLMVYHNIYNSWCWVGGHADGQEDLINVAIREIKEETGVNNVRLLTNIATIDTLPVLGHIKRGEYVSAHVHLSVGYIFEADENEEIRIKADENSKVAWIDIDKVVKLCTEEHMKGVYKKLIDKVNQI